MAVVVAAHAASAANLAGRSAVFFTAHGWPWGRALELEEPAMTGTIRAWVEQLNLASSRRRTV